MTSIEGNCVLDHFYVARQPIFNNSGEIWGYELLYRSGPNKQASEITNEEIATLCVATCGFTQSQEYCDQTKKVLINFTEKLIMEGAPRGLPTSVTVVELPYDTNPSDELMEKLIELKQEGYIIAINNYTGDDHQSKLLNIADIIKIDIRGKTTQETADIFFDLKVNKALKMAEKVDSGEILQPLRSFGCDLYQGFFFAKPVNLRGRKLKRAEASKLRILQAIEDPALDTDTIQEAIKADPSVTIQLLRFLNSAAFGLSVKIESVKHAIHLIGLKRLKYWLRMVVMSELASKNQTPELYTLSLNRGRFLEELSQNEQITSANPDTLFLFGMLSLIEPMLEIPIKNILDELPLSAEIKSGYLNADSTYGKFLQLSIAIEYADSGEIEKLCQEMGVSQLAVASASHRAVAWTTAMSQSMN